MTHYYLDSGSQKKGPYTLNQLRAMWSKGAVNGKTLYCQEGGTQWKKLELMQSVLEMDTAEPKKEPGWFESLRNLFKKGD